LIGVADDHRAGCVCQVPAFREFQAEIASNRRRNPGVLDF
jgi:hypothetical protein